MEDDSASIKAFVELVVKLNDSSFKPLYRKMFDWAWSTGNEPRMLPDDTRAIAYCQVMNAIFSLLKVGCHYSGYRRLTTSKESHDSILGTPRRASR
jgi:hypothetical protein